MTASAKRRSRPRSSTATRSNHGRIAPIAATTKPASTQRGHAMGVRRNSGAAVSWAMLCGKDGSFVREACRNRAVNHLSYCASAAARVHKKIDAKILHPETVHFDRRLRTQGASAMVQIIQTGSPMTSLLLKNARIFDG